MEKYMPLQNVSNESPVPETYCQSFKILGRIGNVYAWELHSSQVKSPSASTSKAAGFLLVDFSIFLGLVDIKFSNTAYVCCLMLCSSCHLQHDLFLATGFLAVLIWISIRRLVLPHCVTSMVRPFITYHVEEEPFQKKKRFFFLPPNVGKRCRFMFSRRS